MRGVREGGKLTIPRAAALSMANPVVAPVSAGGGGAVHHLVAPRVGSRTGLPCLPPESVNHPAHLHNLPDDPHSCGGAQGLTQTAPPVMSLGCTGKRRRLQKCNPGCFVAEIGEIGPLKEFSG